MSKRFIDAKVTIDLKPLGRFRYLIDRDLNRSGNGPVAKALNQWAVRYRGYIQERFARLSRGGGGVWPPLKPSTIAGRRKGSKSILRDTGTLFAALSPIFRKNPGQYQKRIPGGIRVGYGTTAKHPSGKISVAKLAKIHNDGLGRVPKRVIMVQPSQQVKTAMVGDMRRAIARILNE